MTRLDLNQELNKKLRTLIADFIKENNINCERCLKFIEGKCKSKTYCIVKDKVAYVSFLEAEK